MEITFREIEHGSSDYRKALILRYMVLRLETGVGDGGVNTIFDEHPDEKECVLLGAFHGNAIVGGVTLKPTGEGEMLLRSLAVDDKRQGTGIGKKLVLFAHEAARKRGVRRITLNARINVIGFYEKLGYTDTGVLHKYPAVTLTEMYIEL